MQDMPTERIDHDHIRASRVRGTDVYNADGEHLGHIDDIVLTKREGRAEYAIMSFGGFLGIGDRYHPLPWSSLTYDMERGGYVVNVSRQQLEGAQHYGREDEPNWSDPGYADGLLAYYRYPMI